MTNERRGLRSTSGVRIVVAGYLVRGPLGGMASYHLQYLKGLIDLGHEVYFIEDSDDYPSCYDPVRDATGTDASYGLRFAAETFRRAGLGDLWAYHDAHSGSWHGPRANDAIGLCKSSELLLDLGGLAPDRSWLFEIPVRALIDLDPVFTQIRHLTDPAARERARNFTAFFTVGESIGRGADIPDDGLPWRSTRQPIVLSDWPVCDPPSDAGFSTVMLWDSYPVSEFAGRRYGMKSQSFEPFLDLPLRVSVAMELAVGSASAPIDRLRGCGWSIRDSREPTRDPWTYRQYIAASLAEFSVAKQAYVTTRSGWFSDRSAAYLASGRPVLLQETGFSDWIESGRGLLSFQTADQAVEGIEEIRRHHPLHARAARELAECHFDSKRILGDLVESAFGPPRPSEAE